MEIRVGWATDFGREKFDVSMDETDLARILQEPDVGIGIEHLTELTSGEVFALLEITAKWYAVHEQRRVPGTDPVGRGAEIAMLAAERAEIVKSVKHRLGLDPSGAATAATSDASSAAIGTGS